MATVVGTDTSASVQISAHWWPDGKETAALVAQAAEKMDVPAATVIVTPGPVTVRQVTLVARREGEEETVLASSASSGMPPYTALLTGPLPPALLAVAREALNGRQGQLLVRFDGVLGTDEVVRDLDVGEAMSDAPADARHVFLTGTATESPTTDPAAPAATLPLRLTVALGTAPVRAVDLTGTDSAGAPWTVTFSPGGPVPEQLPTAESLDMAVHGESGKPYRRTLRPGASGWTIDEAALGLVTVTCQAPGRTDGAVVVLDVWYEPAGDGLPDHRTVTLGKPDWTASWLVASAQDDLGGELVIDVTETTAGGVAVPKHTVHSTSPQVRV
ncbi:hypothetical protein ACFYW8_03255 [Streptomyces sp. NPDC002742]|uniref:hypothetical protein n=1 Tax=Streptomyces sp. NPDC002742 TaxID=3364663 RepID=UPI0036959718